MHLGNGGMDKIKNFTIKHKVMVFAIAAAMIIIISCYFGIQEKDNWVYEQYGATSDGTVSLYNGQELRLKFTITNDGFQGVMLRFYDIQKPYSNEMIDFTLLDSNEEILSTYSLDMKEILIRSNVFIKLPVEDSKGKDVTLVITGRNIKNVPMIYTSKTSNVDSKLYINNSKKNYTLVLSGVYYEKIRKFDNKIGVGGIILIVLGMLLFWPEKTKKHDTKVLRVLPGLISKLSKIGNNFVFRFVCVILFFILLSLFVQRTYIADYIEKKEIYTVVKEVDTGNYIELNSGVKTFNNIIDLSDKNLCTINYKAKMSNVDPSSKLHITVTEKNTDRVYYDKTIKLKDLSIDNEGYFKIFLDEMAVNSASSNYIVSMNPIDFKSSVLSIYSNKCSNKSKATVNGVYQCCSPISYVTLNDYDYINELYSILSVILLILVAFIYVAVSNKKLPLKAFAFPIIMFLGMVYLFVIPIYSVPDEYSHIDTSYLISNDILGIKEQYYYCYDYKRSIDIETAEYPDYYTTSKDYRRLYSQFFTHSEDRSLSKCTMKNVIDNANTLCYLPCAIGITIARCMGLGTFPMLLMGRFFNLLAFAIICCLAMLVFEEGAILILLYSTMPITLQEASSYSYDGMLNAIAILFFALLFRLCMHKKEMIYIIGLFVCTVLLTTIKGGTYLPVALLSFLPFVGNNRDEKERKYAYIFIISSILCFFSKNAIFVFNKYIGSSSISINPLSGKEIYSFGYLAHNPVKFAIVMVNTFFSEGSRYIYEFFSGKMGSVNEIQMPWLYVVVFGIMFMIFTFSEEIDYPNRKLFNVSVILAAVFSFLLISVALLVSDTNIKLNYVHGVQGRYFIPFVLPLLMIAPKLLKKYKKNSMILLYYLFQMIFIYNIIIVVSAKF